MHNQIKKTLIFTMKEPIALFKVVYYPANKQGKHAKKGNAMREKTFQINKNLKFIVMTIKWMGWHAIEE